MQTNERTAGSLTVLGLGPGDPSCLTPLALTAISRASCVVGYPLYLNLIPQEVLKGKIVHATGMRREEERCAYAIDRALESLNTVLVSSGDPGIYAMAALVLELLETKNLLETIPLTILPAVPALCACAALLGAPIGHDFACVSLSDLLTPWQTIEKRLHAAFSADFVLVLYNPRSHGRPAFLAKTLAIAGRYRTPSCPVGIVRNAFRAGQSVTLCTIEDCPVENVDMLSLVIIGNSQSRKAGPYLLTPRGYSIKERA